MARDSKLVSGMKRWMIPDHMVDFVNEIQNTKEYEHTRKFLTHKHGNLERFLSHGEQPKRAKLVPPKRDASIQRCFGSE